MKKIIKITVCIVAVIAVVCAAVAAPYGYSFIKTDEEYTVAKAESTRQNTDKLYFDFSFGKTGWFNYYGISYYSDSYLKGEICYKAGVKEKTEDFFLEPAENGEFYSFIDDFLEGTKANKVVSLTIEPLDTETANIEIFGFNVFNREIPRREIYIESADYKVGIDLLWGGALSYVEDLNSNVEAVSVDGKIHVDSNAGERYNAQVVNKNVNLINRNDTGRLVQQSYYGTLEYDFGIYMDNDWSYNPVQGGNQFNDSSKIVDLRINEDSIYIKCRPLDWAKEKEYATPSYMEAQYSFVNGLIHASCRFVDFSGYPQAERTQELPAFYCVEPLNNFVYYSGDEPWTDGELTFEKNLIFWPDAGYPKFYSKENWSAFVGEFEDSFGIGLYVPDNEEFLAGVYDRGNTTSEDPSRDTPTSYIAVTKDMTFASFKPIEYEYYLATGDVNEIRDSFSQIK